jgi:hypothetical protein
MYMCTTQRTIVLRDAVETPPALPQSLAEAALQALIEPLQTGPLGSLQLVSTERSKREVLDLAVVLGQYW